MLKNRITTKTEISEKKIEINYPNAIVNEIDVELYKDRKSVV